MSSCYEDDEHDYKTRILKALEDASDGVLPSIIEYLRSEHFPNDLRRIKKLRQEEKPLIKIGESIKKMVPLEGEFDTEKIIMPIIGDNKDCNSENSCHVDEFLYDEEELDKLVEKGKLSKYVCTSCNSRNVKELIMISHSMSKRILQYIFRVLLPEDLQGKQVLDIGSRLGAVLYAAYHLTNSAKVIGIEINQEMCELQNTIIEKHSLDKKRIQVIHANLLDCPDVINQSNVIILNQLDFFATLEEQRVIWKFFKSWFKVGSYFVTNRSVPETLGYLGIQDDFEGWLTILKPCQLDNSVLFDLEDYGDLFMYLVNDIPAS